MIEDVDTRANGSRARLARQVLCWLVVAIACAVLYGWAFNINALKTVLPGLTGMKFNTALGLLAGALGVLAIRSRRRLFAVGAVGAAVLVGAIGAATLCEYAFGWRLGIDELVVADRNTTSPPFNGRMSPATALGFVAIFFSLLILRFAKSRRLITLGHVIACTPAVVGFLSLAGYAYGVEKLYNFGPYVSIALHTGIGLVLLAASLLLTRSAEGWSANISNRPIARRAFLQSGPLAIFVPFVSGLVILWGMRENFYQARFTPAPFAVFAAFTLLWLALRFAGVIGRAEGELDRATADSRRSQAELTETQHRHRALVEGLPQLVWTCRLDGFCDYMSPQWVAYTGVPEQALLGFAWLTRVIHPDDVARTSDHWMGAVAGRHPYDIEYRICRADGVYRWFTGRGSPVRAQDGSIEYWFGTSTDIEDIVQAREVLAKSRVELEAQVAERTADLMRIEAQLRQSQKMEAVGQLTGGIAHDFNNLLTGITGSLEMMQVRIAQGRMADVTKYIAAAQSASLRAAALTHRLLAFARRQTLDPRVVNVNRLVTGMAELIIRTVGPEIAVETVGAAGLWTAIVDPHQLENALLNLCINARDAMPNGGTITIETANKWLDDVGAAERDMLPGQYLSLCVTDTGVGMTPEVIARAFEPFFTTKPLGAGTGLGLSMIYGFAKQSGGQVRIYSEVGLGTTMCVYLPRHNGEEDQPALQLDAAIAGGFAGKTVMVVDDEASVRMLLTDVLGEAGYLVIEAEDGPSGQKILESSARIDLLITDIGLPGGMNGRQLADIARTRRPDLKVLFITGYAENAVIGNGLLESGMAVMTKPFTISAVRSKVREIVSET